MINFNIVNKPDTLYSIMESIVNFDKPKNEKTKIKDLAKESRSTIFDFDYPLTEKINREDFECMILNKFIMRRIGYETVTAFKIQLNVKLNEIMPYYNKLFDALDGWDIFNDGETIDRSITTQNTSSGSRTDETSTSANNRNDSRFSETPSNRLHDVEDGTYLTTYNLDQAENSTQGNLSSLQSGTQNSTGHEITTRSQHDKMTIYKDFIENKNNIYTMIFSDLEPLFYGLL